MIITLVQIKLSEPLSLDKAQKIFVNTAPKYKKIQGLIRKYYLLSEDGKTAGGVYIWESRKAAERLYTDDWKEFVLGKYGTEPSVIYFNSPVLVDNTLGEIVKDVKKL
ncbi:MAG: YdhR family protein [Desulfobacterales bacterium]